MLSSAQSILPKIAAFMADGIVRLLETIPSDDFTFVVNGTESRVSLVEALLLSPHVGSDLKHDANTRRCVIENDGIIGIDIF
jgi:hypothetical protein